MRFDGKLALDIGVKQQLTITNDVIQSLEILRMPIFELSKLVEQRVCENPFLEDKTNNDLLNEDFSSVSIEAIEDERSRLENDGTDALEFDVAYDEPRSGLMREGMREESASPLDFCYQEQSFSDMLLEEIDVLCLDEEESLLCRHLVACLNRRGYFEDDVETLAEKCGRSSSEVERAIGFIQKLQPPGVGARSLQECLLLQLYRSDLPGPLAEKAEKAEKLIAEGLPLLADRNIAGIAALLNVDKDEARRISEIVRNLNPIPSQGYYTGEQDFGIVPEALVKVEGNVCSIVMNDHAVPKLNINEDYAGIFAALSNDEAEKYIKLKRNEAIQLIKSLEERAKTLLRVLTQIVSRQPQYFKEGMPLAPMKMSDIAKALGLNASTVSRAIQGKYILCAAGTVEMKSLFSGIAAQNDKGEILSANCIKKRLKSCIENEDPHQPLSDEGLREVLRSSNIHISRRTVAKYRTDMQIPPAALRRQACPQSKA